MESRRGPLRGLRGCLGCLLGSSGGLWVVLMKTLKNHKVFLYFQHLEVLGGLLRTLFSVFLDFRSYLRPFFRFQSFFSVFYDRICVRFSVSDRFFGFFGRCFLHERIHGRDSAPRAYSRARFGSTRLENQRDPTHLSGGLDPIRAQSYLKRNTRY